MLTIELIYLLAYPKDSLRTAPFYNSNLTALSHDA